MTIPQHRTSLLPIPELGWSRKRKQLERSAIKKTNRLRCSALTSSILYTSSAPPFRDDLDHSNSNPGAADRLLQLYQKKPVALPYFDNDVNLPHSLVFIPGLTDTLGTIPYLPRLAEVIRKHGFSLVQPQLTANMGGYGQCSLEGDAQEVAACVSHLRTTAAKKDGKVVLMGHSTGAKTRLRIYFLPCELSVRKLGLMVRSCKPPYRIEKLMSKIGRQPIHDNAKRWMQNLNWPQSSYNPDKEVHSCLAKMLQLHLCRLILWTLQSRQRLLSRVQTAAKIFRTATLPLSTLPPSQRTALGRCEPKAETMTSSVPISRMRSSHQTSLAHAPSAAPSRTCKMALLVPTSKSLVFWP